MIERAAQGHGLGQMGGQQVVGAVQIGHRAGHTQHPVLAAHRPAKAFGGLRQQLAGFGTDAEAGLEAPHRQPAIAVLLALQLPLKVLVTEQDGRVTVAYTPAAELVKHSAVSEAEVAGTLAKAEILIRATVEQQQ